MFCTTSINESIEKLYNYYIVIFGDISIYVIPVLLKID